MYVWLHGDGYLIFDSNSGGGWASSNNSIYTSSPYDAISDEWIEVDFGANPVDITGLQVTGSVTQTSTPDEFRLEYSDNGTDWFTLNGSSRSGIDTSSTYQYEF